MADKICSSVVHLNVGGRKFATLKSTLFSEPDSMLARLVDDIWTTGLESGDKPPAGKEEGNPIFIDRNGKCFEWILDYLRDRNHFVCPEVLEDQLRLFQEAHYFGLKDLYLDTFRHCLRPANLWFSATGWEPDVGQTVYLEPLLFDTITSTEYNTDGLNSFNNFLQRVALGVITSSTICSNGLTVPTRKKPIFSRSKLQKCKLCGNLEQVLDLDFTLDLWSKYLLAAQPSLLCGEIVEVVPGERCVEVQWNMPRAAELAHAFDSFAQVHSVHMHLRELLPADLL